MNQSYKFYLWISRDASDIMLNNLDVVEAGLKLFFWNSFEYQVDILPNEILAEAFNSNRRQVDIKKFIDVFRDRNPAISSRVDIIIIDRDLYIPGRSYIFSATHLATKTITISIFRLMYGLNLGDESDRAKFRERLYKEVVHEIGHLIGLDHCVRNECVMSFSPDIAHLDNKLPILCNVCVEKAKVLGFNIGFEGEEEI